MLNLKKTSSQTKYMHCFGKTSMIWFSKNRVFVFSRAHEERPNLSLTKNEINPLLHLYSWHFSDASLVRRLSQTAVTIKVSDPLVCPASSRYEKYHPTQFCLNSSWHSRRKLVIASVRLFISHTSYFGRYHFKLCWWYCLVGFS